MKPHLFIWNAYCKHARETKTLRMHIPYIRILMRDKDTAHAYSLYDIYTNTDGGTDLI